MREGKERKGKKRGEERKGKAKRRGKRWITNGFRAFLQTECISFFISFPCGNIMCFSLEHSC